MLLSLGKVQPFAPCPTHPSRPDFLSLGGHTTPLNPERQGALTLPLNYSIILAGSSSSTTISSLHVCLYTYLSSRFGTCPCDALIQGRPVFSRAGVIEFTNLQATKRHVHRDPPPGECMRPPDATQDTHLPGYARVYKSQYQLPILPAHLDRAFGVSPNNIAFPHRQPA